MSRHFAELLFGGRWQRDVSRLRAVYRARDARVFFFVGPDTDPPRPDQRPFWVSAGTVRWVDAIEAERQGKKFRAIAYRYSRRVPKPHPLSPIFTPADVRALAVRLDQWLWTREAA